MIRRDLCTFWKNLGKKMPFWVKKVFPGEKVPYYMVHIAYYTELNIQICNYAQNDAFVAKIANTRLTKTFVAIFVLAERLPTSTTLPSDYKS